MAEKIRYSWYNNSLKGLHVREVLTGLFGLLSFQWPHAAHLPKAAVQMLFVLASDQPRKRGVRQPLLKHMNAVAYGATVAAHRQPVAREALADGGDGHHREGVPPQDGAGSCPPAGAWVPIMHCLEEPGQQGRPLSFGLQPHLCSSAGKASAACNAQGAWRCRETVMSCPQGRSMSCMLM